MLRFGHTYVTTRHVVSIALLGDWLAVRTVADAEDSTSIARFELRKGGRDRDMDAITAIAASTAALTGVVDPTSYLA